MDDSIEEGEEEFKKKLHLERSDISKRTDGSTLLRIGREDLKSVSRLVRAKKIKGEGSRKAVSSLAGNLTGDRTKKQKFL